MNRQAKFLFLCLFVGLFSANLCDDGKNYIDLQRTFNYVCVRVAQQHRCMRLGLFFLSLNDKPVG